MSNESSSNFCADQQIRLGSFILAKDKVIQMFQDVTTILISTAEFVFIFQLSL